MTHRYLLLAALLLPSCAVAAEPPPAPRAPPIHIEAGPIPDAPAARRAEEPRVPLPVAGEDSAIWRVDGRPLTKTDLGDFVLRYFPDRAQDALEQMLDEAIVESDAGREAVTVADATIDARTDADLAERRRHARIEYGADADFEKLLAERYGRDLATWRADARRLVRVLLLRDRLVRLDQTREDGIEIRVLVLPDEDAARAAVKSLREGADMTLYAQRAGVRPPAAPPPSARGEIPEKELEARLFASPEGAIVGPVPFASEGGKTFFQVFKVVRAWKADASAWSIAGRGIERSIETCPVSADETARWRHRAFARHVIEGWRP